MENAAQMIRDIRIHMNDTQKWIESTEIDTPKEDLIERLKVNMQLSQVLADTLEATLSYINKDNILCDDPLKHQHLTPQ